KFVESNQEDLEGLGMQWRMLDGVGSQDADFQIKPEGFDGAAISEIYPTEFKTYISGYTEDGTPINSFLEDEQGDRIPTGYDTVTRPTAGVFNSTMSSGVRTVSNALSAGGDSGVLGMSMVLGAMELSSLIHAIDQTKSSDVLSAPKITTTSGNTAIIRMVQERYFPESWDNPELDSSTGDNDSTTSLTPPAPEFGAPRDIGVILEVTPQVESDGYTIGLDLRPQVLEFLGYDTSFNTVANVGGGDVEFKYNMPIIAARTIQTKIILYDGETVVLGGMIKEQVKSFNDKIPILGDIPLLGRLFKNEGESVVKRNLLIFVTARLVDPAGQPRRAQEIPGLPDFRR
ncbi:MAG: type II and III secretion system protein, partial [Lentisphaeria bacterium]